MNRKIDETLRLRETTAKNNEEEDDDSDEPKGSTVKLRREVDLIGAIFVIIGSQIGSGIFVSPKGTHFPTYGLIILNSRSPGTNWICWLLTYFVDACRSRCDDWSALLRGSWNAGKRVRRRVSNSVQRIQGRQMASVHVRLDVLDYS